jgi:4'-phosphopantetheinyl transferase
VTTSGRGHGKKHLGPVPGTDVEVVRWTSRAGDGGCTVTWLPTDRLDVEVVSSEVTEVERLRAAGFTRGNDRLLSLGSAWLMRRLVAISLDVAPLEAPIVRRCDQCARPHGRPVVRAATRDGATVHVSATHSGALVGIALSTAGAVGLDVEDLQARGPKVWPNVWRVLGHPVVPGSAAGGPEADREAATAWVRTEALLKATGQGLTVSPRSVEISPGEEPAVIRWPWGDPAGRVSVFDLNAGPRYVAALAAIHDGITECELAATRKPVRTSRELV